MILDEGYQFGLGAYETMAVCGGKAVFLKEHLQRLWHALEFLEISRRVSEREITQYIQEHALQDGVLKVMVSEENVEMLERENPYTRQRYETGYSMDYSQIKRNETSPFIYHKTFNHGECILEKRRAQKMGLDELIFINTRGEISEGTSCNIFFVRNGKVLTPGLSSGLLPGVVRRFLCETQNVWETVITCEQVKDFQECFVTNSVVGIMPVRRLGDVEFQEESVTQKIRKMYMDKIKSRPMD